MSDEMRFQTTAIIWIALAAILIFTAGDKIALAFILGIAAAVSTATIWGTPSHSASDQENALKNKRDNRVRRLIEVMDDEEVADMEEYLAARRDDRLSH